MLIASLRDVIRQQSEEIEALHTQLKETKATLNNNIVNSQVRCIDSLVRVSVVVIRSYSFPTLRVK